MSDLEQVYGIHAVSALLAHHPRRVKQLWLVKGRQDASVDALREQAHAARIEIRDIERRELDEKVEGVHQGVLALVSPSQIWGENMLDELLDRLDEPALLLVLDGVHAVIIPKDKSATLNATVRKVACGAAEVVPLVAVTNLSRTLQKLQQKGVWIAGTAGEAEVSIYQQNLSGPLALVMGAEGKGMRRLTREHCDYLVKLPMLGSVSSLNVSVATGVCLFEIRRQRSV